MTLMAKYKLCGAAMWMGGLTLFYTSLSAHAASLADKRYLSSPQRYQATYRVPTPDLEMAPAAIFVLGSVKWIEDSDQIRVSYEMPSELFGAKSKTFVLEGKRSHSKFTALQGSGAEAHCLIPKVGKIICLLSFSNLSIDLAEVKSHLEKSHTTGSDLEKQISVAKLFSADPVGILEIERP